MTADRGRCLACGSDAVHVFLRVDGLPALTNELWRTEAEARQAPTGRLELAFCQDCSSISNVAFEPELTRYSPAYENALHHSRAFRRYAEELAGRLVRRYDLHGKDLVDIGCGDGAFLGLLCDLGDNRGIGFDPSFDPGRAGVAASERVTILPEPYPSRMALSPDFVCCRHVLEHIFDPSALVASVRASIHGRGRLQTYFEVPDAVYMLKYSAIWDLLYEHCSYFTDVALRRLFMRSGFDPVETGTSFGGQYLWIEAVATAANDQDEPLEPAVVARFRRMVDGFESDFLALVARSRERLTDMRKTGRVALWGAGTKGLTFLNLVDPERTVDAVVDVNPRKRGGFVAVTGHRVSAPKDLVADPPGHVIVMNPIYEDEIRRTLAALGIAAGVSVM